MDTFQVTYSIGNSERSVPITAMYYEIMENGVLVFYNESGQRKCAFKEWISMTKSNSTRQSYFPGNDFTQATIRSIKNPEQRVRGNEFHNEEKIMKTT